MASQSNGTLYVGVTNNIPLRAYQHRIGVGSTFTTKYRVKMLVWYEIYGDVNEAIARKAVEDMGTQVEARADRAVQSRMARLVRNAERLKARLRA
jgi:GIY-YIG catalytic domain